MNTVILKQVASMRRSNAQHERLDGLEMRQAAVDRDAPRIPVILNIAESTAALVRRALSSLEEIFKSFFSGTLTLNEPTGDKAFLENLYGESIHAYAYVNNNTHMKTHQRRYQCVLLPRRPNPEAPLSVGYYLFRGQEAGVLEQIYITISHPNPEVNPRETFNLNEINPPQNIETILNALPFPNHDQPAIPQILHPDLIQWIASISLYNTTNIHPYHIFLKEETTEDFCKYFSIEARKPQRIHGEEYRSLVTENGWWGSTGAFFQNTAARIWYIWSGRPREYGHDTVINHSDIERQDGVREAEIFLILPLITNSFIQNHSGKISSAVREYCEQNNGVALRR